MCRYGMSTYKDHWACFRCRKMFRRPQSFELAYPVAKDKAESAVCPQCKSPMRNMGWDFKAPKQSDVKQWRKVELILAHGYTYYSCGCNGPGQRPKTIKEVPNFLTEQIATKKEIARQSLNKDRANLLSQRRTERAKQRQIKHYRTMTTSNPLAAEECYDTDVSISIDV